MKDKFIERLTKLIDEVSKINEDFSPQAFNYMKKEYGLTDDNVRNELALQQAIDNAYDFDKNDRMLIDSLPTSTYSIHGTVDGYDCKIQIDYDKANNKFKCHDNMIDQDGDWFDSPVEAFDNFLNYISNYLEYEEENVDDEEYETDFDFPDYNERELEKWGEHCQQTWVK